MNIIKSSLFRVFLIGTLVVHGGQLLLAYDEDKLKQDLVGNLVVDNQTEYDLKFTVKFFHYKNWGDWEVPGVVSYVPYIGDYEVVSALIPKRTEDVALFISGDEEHTYLFGKVGDVSEKLIISSDEWPEEEAIVIVLKKERKKGLDVVQRRYSGEIMPFIGEGEEWSALISWELRWKEGRWMLILKQDMAKTGFMPYEEL